MLLGPSNIPVNSFQHEDTKCVTLPLQFSFNVSTMLQWGLPTVWVSRNVPKRWKTKIFHLLGTFSGNPSLWAGNTSTKYLAVTPIVGTSGGSSCSSWAQMHLMFMAMPVHKNTGTPAPNPILSTPCPVFLCIGECKPAWTGAIQCVRGWCSTNRMSWQEYSLDQATFLYIPVNSFQSLQGPIFPSEFSITMKLILATIRLKDILLDNLSSWPFCCHPGIPYEKKRFLNNWSCNFRQAPRAHTGTTGTGRLNMLHGVSSDVARLASHDLTALLRGWGCCKGRTTVHACSNFTLADIATNLPPAVVNSVVIVLVHEITITRWTSHRGSARLLGVAPLM